MRRGYVFFLWKDMVEMTYDINDRSRKRMNFQKIDTLIWIVFISFLIYIPWLATTYAFI